ncbi:hypothetical protein SAMN02745150_00659 [Brevinema andersonii]|uniref:Uncharacterized protein n=1 Tax=Brevinema andersonii TaxID=34097 RepID=A0A1I1DT18_BREAD|nr:hypothetical protein [Brevinema andersonii]SFB75870.1 hypothetical protein SAMN02745150_00659 [Brevinema andersonii]
MKKVLLLFIFAACSVTPKEEFIRNVYGTYNLLNSAGQLNISSAGTISENKTVLYSLYLTFTSISALYMVSDTSLGSGYVMVSFQNNILYVSDIFTDINQTHQIQLNAYAIRIG